MPTPAPTRTTVVLAVALALSLGLGACGGGGRDVGQERADQVRAAARKAGLSAEVTDLLALAANAETSTFQVAYRGTDGARIVVLQAPPDRRVDVLTGDVVVSSRVLHDDVAYRCEPAQGDKAKPGDLTCQRAAGALDATGGFTDEALKTFTDQLAAQKGALAMTVASRTIAGVKVRCITSTPKAGTPIDGTGPGTDVLCLSAEGAQLLIDHAGDRLVADKYTTEVPKGTFDV